MGHQEQLLTKPSEHKNDQRARIDRFRELLTAFGRILGFEASPSEQVVTWDRPDSAKIVFSLQDEVVSVDTSLPGNFGALLPWGVMTYPRLERALWVWCGKHGDQGQRIREKLSIVPEEDGASARAGSVMRHMKLPVLSNERIYEGHYLIRFELPCGEDAVNPIPGQFFHVICDDNSVDGEGRPLTLRRPFSINGIGYEQFDRRLLAVSGDLPQEIRDAFERRPSEVSLLYRVVGEGTRYLTRITPGQLLDVIGPCGHGFDAIEPDTTAVLVAGGMGAAPLAALAEHLRYLNQRVHLYLGACSQEFLASAMCRPDPTIDRCFTEDPTEFRRIITEEYLEIGVAADDLHICTDDGSEGEKGFVTAMLDEDLRTGRLPKEHLRVYACGPHGMLRAVAGITEKHGVDCKVLMEERMACGIGACMACTCKTITPQGIVKKRVCKDGPVFDAREIEW